ncbi:hypothetical protein TEA_027690 [Camellia sinensis var. sinensis]|uniref:Potassium transporter n=1 Tax=Camellia sinensis var. sinensis TaxID=542762 RepID=A0A4S4EMG3_CAMSN|nr:hypothetical protein TEA_027690 [Camellia sinensis var. sinensis]
MAEEEPQQHTEEADNNNNNSIKERKVSWAKLRRVDSLNLEAGRLDFSTKHTSLVNWKATMSLVFQSIGVIYGDLGTSPLYVYQGTFPDGISNTDDLLGVFSLILYTLLLIPLLKYVFIVLRANDNGDGGTFALYSLICRYAKVSLLPNHQPEDRQLSNYNLDLPSNQLKRAQKIKEKLENSKTAKLLLFLVTILGTSMVIGDGILTPCISVLSAVSGFKSLSKDAVVGISVAILIILFSVQRFGTDKVGYMFAPILLLWFLFISVIGLYNLFKYDASVLRAFNPKYVVDYFKRNGKKGWISLGGVVLCTTGTEAMFADLGHFNVRSVQISFSGIVFPAILAVYSGQTAYLVKFPDQVDNAFYACVPGIAVVAVMVITTYMVTLIMLLSWKTSIWWIALFFVVFSSIESLYLSAVLYKFIQGGYLPLAFSAVLMMIMGAWHYVYKQRYMFELKNKVSNDFIRDLSLNPDINRLPGIGLLYSELVQGIPPIFRHFIANIPSVHSVLVFVSIKSIPVSKVAMEERFLFRQVEPRDYRMFRCVVRYGYNDAIEEPKEFERQLVENLKEFIRHEHFICEGTALSSSTVYIEESLQQQQYNSPHVSSSGSIQPFNVVAAESANSSSRIISAPIQGAEEEMQFVQKAMDNGVVYLLGEAEVRAEQNSSIFKKIVVDYGYSFLRKNFRQGEKVLAIPQSRLLRVGMTYEI